MERAIIHSDLKKKEIHPSALLKNYLNLLEEDIRNIFLTSSIENDLQPANEHDVNHKLYLYTYFKYMYPFYVIIEIISEFMKFIILVKY